MSGDSHEGKSESTAGKVYLVGSGPGDPNLLTVKAKRLLESADVVLHDKLPGPEVIDLVPEERREDVAGRDKRAARRTRPRGRVGRPPEGGRPVRLRPRRGRGRTPRRARGLL